MNFYKRFIGDIQKKTGHLSMAEFGAYDRLLDHYYALEKPLPLLASDCYRICRAMVKSERDAVDRVLREFFMRTNAGYVHERAEEAMADAQIKIEANRLNGKKGGRPKKAPVVNENGTQQKPSGFPDGSHTEPNKNLSQSQIPSVTDVTAGAPATQPPPSPPPPPEGPTNRELLFANGVALLTAAGVVEKNARSMLAGLAKRHGDAAVVAAVQACADEGAVEPVSFLQRRLRSAPAPQRQQQPTTSTRNAGILAGLAGKRSGAPDADHFAGTFDVQARVIDSPETCGA